MATTITSTKFVTKLTECVKEYRKQLNATRDDADAAHFFDKNLKKFLVDHKDDIIVLSGLNFDRSFTSWLKNYLYK